MPHVFISYLRENSAEIEALAERLREAGVDVWIDRDRIQPGERWKGAIRAAIRDGGFFLACFSAEYENRVRTYMNEELALAVEELRLRPASRIWFIPILLDAVEVPELPIGPGETLRDLQWVPLYADFEGGVRKILHALTPGDVREAPAEGSSRRSKHILPVAGAAAAVLAAAWVFSSGRPVTFQEPEPPLATRLENEEPYLSKWNAAPEETTEPEETTVREETTVPKKILAPKEKEAEEDLSEARGTFEVSLVLPSRLQGADIEVDGKPADVVERRPILVKIRVPIREGGSQVTVRKDGFHCTRTVTRDEGSPISITLPDCSRENA